MPGVWHNQLRIVNAWVGLSSCTAPELARPAVALAPPSLTSTCVLRVHADWVYFDAAKTWDAATASPGATFRRWATEAVGRVQDSCMGLGTEAWARRPICIQGLVRLTAPLAAAALAKSGSSHHGGRWFLQPPALPYTLHDHGVPDLAVDWIAWVRSTVRRPATGADRRLTPFTTRIPTLQPVSPLYNHGRCFRCENPHFTTRHPTLQPRMFACLFACLHIFVRRLTS